MTADREGQELVVFRVAALDHYAWIIEPGRLMDQKGEPQTHLILVHVAPQFPSAEHLTEFCCDVRRKKQDT